MAVDYTGCECGGAGSGDGCCAPSTSTEQFCLADGSTILAVYQVPCAACDAAATPPTLSGYLNPNTGVFTPGPLPADAGRCEDCARQVVERCGCDDVNGDGTVINRYIELWSVDPCNGGTPELVGTWLDGDFDQPYTVVNPVECPAASEVFQHQEILCDAPAPAVGELVTNGTFATNTAGWTFFGGGTGNGWGPPDFGYAGPDGSAGVMAYNTGNRPPLGGISQTIATQAGAPYQFKARVGARSTTGDDGSPMRLLVEVVSAAGAVLFSRTVAPTYTVGSGLAWPADGAVDVPVTAVDSSLTLRFTDASTGAAVGVDLLLDDVSLTQTGPGTPIQFIRKYVQDAAGAVTDTVDFDLSGQPYTVVGSVGRCTQGVQFDVETSPVCSFDTNGELASAGLTLVRVFDQATGDFVRQYLLTQSGTLYTVPAGYSVFPCDTMEAWDSAVQTGIRRLTNSTVAQNLKTEFPGLQSVTLTVLSGGVAATMTNGASQVVPAGVSLTWSVTDTDDSSLSIASFTGQASSDYLLNWTHKTREQGDV